MGEKLSKNFIIGTFVTLYVMVSIISTIHVIDFFELSNPKWLAITLAIAFEVGAAASLASIIALKKMNKSIVWALFFILTAMQAMGNTYYAYNNLEDFKTWSELFGLVDFEPIFQKRVMSIVSGAILPLVALGFIKSLVDYIKPSEDPVPEKVLNEENISSEKVSEDIEDDLDNYNDQIDKWTAYVDNMDAVALEEDADEDPLIGWDYDKDYELEDEESLSEYYENIVAYRENSQPEEIDLKEEWDEDHALDMVMNDMVEDMDIQDFENQDTVNVVEDTIEDNKYDDSIMVFKKDGNK